MEQRDEAGRPKYPLGRGYGQDYMRGGEVFGGYGYSSREDYDRPRGAERGDHPHGVIEQGAGSLPHDNAAGAWRDEPGMFETAPRLESTQTNDPSEPSFPHLFGGIGGAHRHSRSFYATQAQLQARIYGPQRYGRGPYYSRVQAVRRPDEELKGEVEEALFYDTWVDAQRIAVEVRDAVVTLRGALPSHEEVRFACDDAWDVPGVRGVVSELVVGEEGRAVD